MRFRHWRLFAALLVVLALVAAACGDDDDDVSSGTTDGSSATTEGTTGTTEGTTATTEGTTDGSAPAATDFKACQVTDTGGIDDRSFNQTVDAGLDRASTELGVQTDFLESQSADDFEPNINAFLGECDLIVTVGFLLGDATAAAAEANPEQDFAIVDYAYDPTIPNVLGLTFQTDQAAFLAGYLAAGMTQTGVVGTFGGINIPTVTIFMEGFLNGVNYYNTQKGTTVEVIGWDGTDGLFTGDFENQDNGRRTAQSLLDEGADIIMPVAGPVGLGAAAAVQEAGDASLIWVDTDGYVSAADYGPLFLTSVLKNMDTAVFDAVQSAVDGTFAGGIYSGTLENDGVGLAPFHDFDAQVPEELKAEILEIQQGIIDGTISVTG